MFFRKKHVHEQAIRFRAGLAFGAGTGRLRRRRRWRRRPNHGHPARHNAEPAATQGDRTGKQSTSCPIPFSR